MDQRRATIAAAVEALAHDLSAANMHTMRVYQRVAAQLGLLELYPAADLHFARRSQGFTIHSDAEKGDGQALPPPPAEVPRISIVIDWETATARDAIRLAAPQLGALLQDVRMEQGGMQLQPDDLLVNRLPPTVSSVRMTARGREGVAAWLQLLKEGVEDKEDLDANLESKGLMDSQETRTERPGLMDSEEATTGSLMD